MPHDCAGPAVSDVTMFGISQVVPAIRSGKPQLLVAAYPARYASQIAGPAVLPDESISLRKNNSLSELQKL
jgi:hypothetical protein